jgi:hypothetical protein
VKRCSCRRETGCSSWAFTRVQGSSADLSLRKVGTFSCLVPPPNPFRLRIPPNPQVPFRLRIARATSGFPRRNTRFPPERARIPFLWTEVRLSTDAGRRPDRGHRDGEGGDSGLRNGVSVMGEIDSLRERLETPAPSADGVAGTLEAAWAGFDLLLATCRACEDQSAELFAAFSFASAAAAQGRQLVWGAPSLPLTSAGQSRRAVSVADDLEGITDALAGLAQVMSGRLSSAARDAPDPGDRGACADAAREAGQIYQLLKRDR